MKIVFKALRVNETVLMIQTMEEYKKMVGHFAAGYGKYIHVY
jgi:hypothetical protein